MKVRKATPTRLATARGLKLQQAEPARRKGRDAIAGVSGSAYEGRESYSPARRPCPLRREASSTLDEANGGRMVEGGGGGGVEEEGGSDESARTREDIIARV